MALRQHNRHPTHIRKPALSAQVAYFCTYSCINLAFAACPPDIKIDRTVCPRAFIVSIMCLVCSAIACERHAPFHQYTPPTSSVTLNLSARSPSPASSLSPTIDPRICASASGDRLPVHHQHSVHRNNTQTMQIRIKVHILCQLDQTRHSGLDSEFFQLFRQHNVHALLLFLGQLLETPVCRVRREHKVDQLVLSASPPKTKHPPVQCSTVPPHSSTTPETPHSTQSGAYTPYTLHTLYGPHTPGTKIP